MPKVAFFKPKAKDEKCDRQEPLFCKYPVLLNAKNNSQNLADAVITIFKKMVYFCV